MRFRRYSSVIGSCVLDEVRKGVGLMCGITRESCLALAIVLMLLWEGDVLPSPPMSGDSCVSLDSQKEDRVDLVEGVVNNSQILAVSNVQAVHALLCVVHDVHRDYSYCY